MSSGILANVSVKLSSSILHLGGKKLHAPHVAEHHFYPKNVKDLLNIFVDPAWLLMGNFGRFFIGQTDRQYLGHMSCHCVVSRM